MPTAPDCLLLGTTFSLGFLLTIPDSSFSSSSLPCAQALSPIFCKYCYSLGFCPQALFLHDIYSWLLPIQASQGLPNLIHSSKVTPYFQITIHLQGCPKASANLNLVFPPKPASLSPERSSSINCTSSQLNQSSYFAIILKTILSHGLPRSL